MAKVPIVTNVNFKLSQWLIDGQTKINAEAIAQVGLIITWCSVITGLPHD